MERAERPLRPDIQGLRAVAVLVVLAYHLWPDAVPGGYVGVDVFFVISGYLITGVLLGDALQRGRVAIGQFYARRIKRLLPAATVVLLAVAACTPLLPEGRRADTAIEIAASALYVQNYRLAQRARDYLAADDAPSIVQHYWSLSVEEQYYIVWPLLLWLAALVGRGRSRPRTTFAMLIAVLFAVSIARSVSLTNADASQAYFATTARAWELALGGALAVIASAPDAFSGARRWLGLPGLAAILGACAGFSARTPFPGYVALLPTLGAFAVLAAGLAGARWPGDVLLRNRALVYVGGISYSLYLWHWPVQIALELQVQRPLQLAEGVLAVAVSIALAHFTKRWVEDPCRAASFASARPSHPFLLAAGCTAVTWLVAGAIYVASAAGAPDGSSASRAAGALALDDPGYDYRRERLDTVVPRPAAAGDDVASAYAEGCYQTVQGTGLKLCVYGDERAEVELAVIGDSHAVHWFPAFEELAKRYRLRVYGIAKNACPFSLDTIQHLSLGRPYSECLSWSNEVVAWLADHEPDAVLLSQAPVYSADGGNPFDQVDQVAAGMVKAWRAIAARGLRPIAIAATPWLPAEKAPHDCLLMARDWRRDCVFDQSAVLLRRDIIRATAELTGAETMDINDMFCIGGRCPPIIGGVLVYRDHHHVTATYARTLAGRFERELASRGVRLTPR